MDSLFFTAFVFIFLAALPGRTTFVLLMMASQGKWKSIFWGAAAAFAVQSFISVALGGILAFLPPWVIQIMAGGLFIYFAFKFWREGQRPVEISSVGSVRSIFFLIFAAEWGDVSQLAIASTSAHTSSRFTVFLAAVTALWLITILAIVAGNYFGRVFNPRILQKIASVAFFTIGIYLMFQGISSFAKN